MQFGDRNTKYYHASTIARRRKNRIEYLEDDNGNQVVGIGQMWSMTCSFFCDLYTVEDRAPFSIPLGCFHVLSTNLMEQVHATISDGEIKGAIFSIGLLKALGPDGLQHIFY